jgi:hypothetical protein
MRVTGFGRLPTYFDSRKRTGVAHSGRAVRNCQRARRFTAPRADAQKLGGKLGLQYIVANYTKAEFLDVESIRPDLNDKMGGIVFGPISHVLTMAVLWGDWSGDTIRPLSDADEDYAVIKYYRMRYGRTWTDVTKYYLNKMRQRYPVDVAEIEKGGRLG